MIILFTIVLVVRLLRHVYRLYNFNNLQMPDRYIKQHCCPITMLRNKSDVFLEMHPITIVISVRIHIETIMGYPTQFLMSRKSKKKNIEYHSSVLHEEIYFDWSRIEFLYKDEPIFFLSTTQVPSHWRLKTRGLINNQLNSSIICNF